MLTILNDCHLAASRSAGTTANTKIALRARLIEQFKDLLPTDASDLMILGDLFDTFDINPLDLYSAYVLLANWLELNKAAQLYLIAGNHDVSKTSSTVSSFELLCNLLRYSYASQVKVILEPTMTPYGYVIPHLPNQTLFNEALALVPECQNLFLHVNYDNHFAVQSDQSLNLTELQADACKAKRIIIAHEHNMKQSGKILIPGNQIASSVSDWISSPTKYYTQVDGTEARLVACRQRDSEYTEVDWKLLETATTPFIRVVGKVKPEDATLAITAIAKFRAVSPALVISSAIEVLTEDDSAQFAASLESAQAFDVMKALGKHLSAEQLQKIQELT